MVLKKSQAIGKEKRLMPCGVTAYYWIFKCSECDNTFKAQTGVIKKRSGKCLKCAQKKLLPHRSAYNGLVKNAIRRKIEVGLTFEQFCKIRENNFCHYCNIKISLGLTKRDSNYGATYIDRKDSYKGYFLDNCVLCCPRCNYTKSNRFTYEEFLKVGEIISTLKKNLNPDSREEFLFLNDLYE